MKVKTTAEAWKKANELFPTDYMKDEALSQKAGYPTYYSTSSEHQNDHINDLNARLEVCIGSECINIWIEEMEASKVTMSKKLYTDIWLLINDKIRYAEINIEKQLKLLDATDHLSEDSTGLIKSIVDEIKINREIKSKYEAMLEQFEKEVEE